MRRASSLIAACVATTGALALKEFKARPMASHGKTGDLAFMHIPYNFGHTIEKVAMFPENTRTGHVHSWLKKNLHGYGRFKKFDQSAKDNMWRSIKAEAKSAADVWGNFHPDLQEVSEITGCALYSTPQKHWPKELARSYFGDKKIFGMLRDPYERLIAMFRGSVMMMAQGNGYGNDFDKQSLLTCNANRGIKKMLQRYIASGDPAKENAKSSCAFTPQADYFEGEYGITIPVDNMAFPAAMNAVFKEHGYDHHIETKDIIHIYSCPNTWAKDLDAETKALVRQVYAKDFDLICKYYGKCDHERNYCIHGVPLMCPKSQCQGFEKCAVEPVSLVGTNRTAQEDAWEIPIPE